MRPIMKCAALRTWALASLCASTQLGCSSDDDKDPFIEVPDDFRATFVAGQVCMPSEMQTGTSQASGAPTYPMRFDICRHRCITFDRSTLRIQQSFACYAGQCEMAVLTIVEAHRVPSEENCNALELVNPPEGQCTPDFFEFNDLLEPPMLNGEYVASDFTVTIPFFNVQEGEDVVTRIEAGEPTQQVLMDYPQTDPDRKFVVNFDPGNAGPPYELDCHEIPPP